MNKKISFSIITPCINRVKFIKKAIESVTIQDHHIIEHLIIDGGSTDGTLELLENYPHLKVISEPDQGMYFAINKGILLADGDIIGLLNTDDFYEPGIFGLIVKEFLSNPNIDAVVGGTEILKFNESGNRSARFRFSAIFPDEFWYRITIGPPNTNAWFFRKTLFDRVGIFNTRYRIISDRDIILRLGLNNVEYKPIDRIFYHYQEHPGSYTLDGKYDGEAEYMFELREMVEDYLAMDEISPVIRKYLLTWHSDILSGQFISGIRKRSLTRPIGYAYHGIRANPRWPIVFIQRISRAIHKRLMDLKLEGSS